MKKILLIILMLIPFVVYGAECDHNKHDEYATFANNVNYDTDFNVDKRKYTINIYNIVKGLYVEYDGKKYERNSNNEVIIDNVDEGTYMTIYVYGDDNCDSTLRTLFVNLLYYNKFYGTGVCVGYEDKLTMCNSQFTTSLVTEEILQTAKENYDNTIIQDADKQENNNSDVTLYSKIRSFALNWGIKFVLVLVTIILSTAFYSSKYRKLKHGI